MTKPELSQHLWLSKNGEKHIRKHYEEFGFESQSELTNEWIVARARKIINNCDDMLRDVDDDSRIFLCQTEVLIVNTSNNAIRTMYVLGERSFLERRVAEGKWLRIH